MALYNIRYVHAIAPGPDDTEGPYEIRDGAFSNRTTLGRALREIGVLDRGRRLRTFRVEGDKTIAFPVSTLSNRSIWHAFVIEPADNYEPTHRTLLHPKFDPEGIPMYPGRIARRPRRSR